jgi:hypothetical protein
MLDRFLVIVTLILLCEFLSGCNDITRSEKFDRERWKEYSEVDGPNRDLMANDLLKTHKLVGLTNKQMLQLLGSPSNFSDTTKTYYELATEFDEIDPISGKNLVITFNKDSVITSAVIKEWHKH